MDFEIEQTAENSLEIRDENGKYVCEIIAQNNDELSYEELNNAKLIVEALKLITN